jgi:hypothetical protein
VLSMSRTLALRCSARCVSLRRPWSRNVGTDATDPEWTGRLVVVGAVTTAWDRRTTSSRRWATVVLLRMTPRKADRLLPQGHSQHGSEVQMRTSWRCRR